jgi:hypothetical protein
MSTAAVLEQTLVTHIDALKTGEPFQQFEAEVLERVVQGLKLIERDVTFANIVDALGNIRGFVGEVAQAPGSNVLAGHLQRLRSYAPEYVEQVTAALLPQLRETIGAQ